MAQVIQLFNCNISEKDESFYGDRDRSQGHLLVYMCENTEGNFLGLVLVQNEGPPSHTRLALPPGPLAYSHLDNSLSVLLAMHMLHLAPLRPSSSVLVQPPLYKDSGCLALVAHHLGAKQVISSSCVDSVTEDFALSAPRTVILKNEISTMNVMPLTGKGADIAVLFQPQDLTEYLPLVGMNGSVILCGNIDPTQVIGMSVFLRNISMHCVDTLHMVEQVCQMKGQEKAEMERKFGDTLMALNDTICNMYPSGLEGYFFRVLAKVLELDTEHMPCEAQLLNTLGIDTPQPSKFQDPHHTQLAAVNFIAQALYSTDLTSHIIIPSIFSSQPDEVMKMFGDGEARQRESLKKANEEIKLTLEKLRYRCPRRSLRNLSSVRLTSLTQDNLPLNPRATTVKLPKSMEDGNNNSTGIKEIGDQLTLIQRRGFDVSASLDSLTQHSLAPLVHLNSCLSGTPMVIVHPILGTVDCLSELARLLPLPVYGLQLSASAQEQCQHGIQNLAQFYIQELARHELEGPVYLAGYSYGSVIAWEMAQQLPEGRVLHLMMLDGSPHYVKTCIEHDLAFVPHPGPKGKETSLELKQQRFECALLMTYVRLYKKVDNYKLACLLMAQECQDDRIKMAVDLSLGLTEIKDCAVPPLTRWRLASDRLVKHLQRAAYRQSVASMRSVLLSCQDCRDSISDSVTEGLHNLSMTSEGDDHVFLAPSAATPQPSGSVEDRDSLHAQCRQQCRQEMATLMPELDQEDPAHSARSCGQRVVWAVRHRGARALVALGMMMMGHVPRTLCGVACSLVRVKQPPGHMSPGSLDLHYGLQELTCQEKLLIAFVEGNHLSCLQEPYVPQMADSVRTLLQL